MLNGACNSENEIEEEKKNDFRTFGERRMCDFHKNRKTNMRERRTVTV